MREGEICALRWVDVKFENDLINVNNNLVYRGAGMISLDDPKTDSRKLMFSCQKIEKDAETNQKKPESILNQRITKRLIYNFLE